MTELEGNILGNAIGLALIIFILWLLRDKPRKKKYVIQKTSSICIRCNKCIKDLSEPFPCVDKASGINDVIFYKVTDNSGSYYPYHTNEIFDSYKLAIKKCKSLNNSSLNELGLTVADLGL